MGKLIGILGKSGSGKDTLVNKLLQDEYWKEKISLIVPYTNRPIRVGEINGSTYNFVTTEEANKLIESAKCIEYRKYNTVAGEWIYFTMKDEQFNTDKMLLSIVTLESFRMMKEKGIDITGIYIELDTEERIKRIYDRECKQNNPNFKEICRRIITDADDFRGIYNTDGIKIVQNNEDISIALKNLKYILEELKYTCN